MEESPWRLTNFGVNFDPQRLPTAAQWEAALHELGVDFTFPTGFEPANCESDQVVNVLYDSVHCTFQLGFFLGHFSRNRPNALFQYDGDSLADRLAALLAAGALAVVTDGHIHWQRAKGGTAQGKHAFTILRNDAKRQRDEWIKVPEFKTRRLGDAAAVDIYNVDWMKCPRCGIRFTQHDPRAWDGEKHRQCGQMITPLGNPPTEATSADPDVLSKGAHPSAKRRWWWPWGGGG